MNASEGWLTPDRLADEAGTTPDYITRLVQAGAITAGVDGLFPAETLPQVRLALALAEGDNLDDLMSVVGKGGFQLSWVGRLWAASEPTGRTFEEFSRTLGERAGQLPAIYAAFGLAPPSPDTMMDRDDERVVTDFLGMWTSSTIVPRCTSVPPASPETGFGGSRARRRTCSTSLADRPITSSPWASRWPRRWCRPFVSAPFSQT